MSRQLQAQGLTVIRGGTEPAEAFPFFAVRAVRLVASGEDVHVFAYAAEELAVNDASKVPSSGSPIGTSQVAWMSPPRFYAKNRLIVLYVGTNLAVARALETVMGQPFAGAK